MTKENQNQNLLEVQKVSEALKNMNQQNLEELKQLKNEINAKLFDMTKQQLYNRIHTTLKIDQQALKQKQDTKDAVRQMKIILQTVVKHIEVFHVNAQLERLKKMETKKLKGKV